MNKTLIKSDRYSTYDKLPPCDQTAEMCVIGSCLLSPVDCAPLCLEQIKSDEYFYDVRCKGVWNLIASTEPSKIDIIYFSQTVNHAFLSECANSVPSTANLPVWIEIIVEKYTFRKVIATCTNLISKCYDPSNKACEVLDEAEREILAIRPQKAEKQSAKELVLDALHVIEKKALNPNTLSGLSTGLVDLDRMTDGVHNGEMIVIAAYPSCGKTALAVGIAVKNALDKIPVAVFSAEMRPVQIMVRALCSESRLNFYRVTEDDCVKLTVAAKNIASAPIYIEQASKLSIGQIQAIARRLKQRQGIKLAVIDYIQLLTGTGDNREQEVSSISKGVKAMALELDIPVIALSQLTDDGKLRESRAIGQDADSVWKLANEGDWKPDIQPVKLTIEKCRDGQTGSIDLTFMKSFTRFENAKKIESADMPYAD